MERPKVTIITPVFNAVNTLEQTIKSVIEQTYSNIEYILIDGGSTDGTIQLIATYRQSIAHYISEPDAGIYDAMNKGIALATGDWLYFLGSDDLLYHNRVVESLFTNPKNMQVDIIYGNVKFKISGARYDGKFSSVKLLQRNICHQAIFVKKHVFDTLGNFNTKYKMLADWCFNMHWFNHPTIRHRFVNTIIAEYNEGGLSFNVPDEAFRLDRAGIEKKNFSSFSRFIFRNRHRKGFTTLSNLFYPI